MAIKGMTLSFMEWLTILFVMGSTGVSVVAYAFTHFESIDSSDKRELRLNEGIKELRENQKTLMEGLGMQYKAGQPAKP